MTPCSLIYPYLDNPSMLNVQIRAWNEYPAALADNIQLIIVDDCSQTNPEAVLRQCRLKKHLLRFDEPGLWTMHEARNLGAIFSSDKYANHWMLMSDIDLVATASFVSALLTRNIDRTSHYTFGRVLAPDMVRYPGHQNSFLVRPEAFRQLNGYDVDFCGLYGGGYGGDDIFMSQLRHIAPRIHWDDLALIGYTSRIISDADTRRWPRKEWHMRYLTRLREKMEHSDLMSRNPVRRRWRLVV